MSTLPLQVQAEAYAFRELVKHLQWRKDVQNIDLMNLSGFCRNCLSKWYFAGALQLGLNIDYDDACEEVYGMSYADWKQAHQTKATAEQLKQMEDAKAGHAKHPPLPLKKDGKERAGTVLQPTSVAPPRSLGATSSVCCTTADEIAAAAAAPVGEPGSDSAAAPSSQVIRLGVLTLSDRASSGLYNDLSGPAIVDSVTAFASTIGLATEDSVAEESAGSSGLVVQVTRQAVLPDNQALIERTLEEWSDAVDSDAHSAKAACNLILTTGGTGLAPRDVTPEATKAVVERTLPGLAQAVLAHWVHREPAALLARCVAGVRGRTLIVNLPGRPAAVRQHLAVLLPLLPYMIAQVDPP